MEFNIEKVSNSLKDKIQHKINNKTKPLGSLGKLEQIALKISLIQGTLTPELNNPTIIVFASDHGICSEKVSAYPQDVTHQMVLNFLNCGAAINVFCRQNNIAIKIVDAGVNFDFPENKNLINAKIGYGTKNFLAEPAMTIDELNQAIKKGMDIVRSVHAEDSNVIGFGEMGIGNTSSASVIMSQLLGLNIEECIGRGAGLDDEGLKNKAEILKRAVNKYSKTNGDAFEVLTKFGGFEIAMITGAILQAAELKMLILIDGFIVTSALLAAYFLDKNVIDYCIFSHVSDEKGHRIMLDKLGVEPVLDLRMRLGEGTGAAVVYPVILSAVAFFNRMASFDSAGVSTKI